MSVPTKSIFLGALKHLFGSVSFCQSDGQTRAILREGVHRLSVRDPATGARVETWIRVKAP